MSDEQPVDATVVEEPPMGEEAAAAVEDFIPAPTDLVLHDPDDAHERAVVMDQHDVRMLLDRVQASALKKWVYQLPGQGNPTGLTVDAVQDLTQLMNWTGKARIGVVPETLTVERIEENIGNGPEPLWVATVFARDEVSGSQFPGTSMEPVYMLLTEATAAKWRAKGKVVPEDRRVFDVFSRTKSINKAYRNALAAFIPEELEQTIIAMFLKQPDRVEKIRTPAQAEVESMPPPLDDEEARGLIAECEAVYARIKELGGGQGRMVLTPGHFGGFMLRSQHSHARLAEFRDWLLQREKEIAADFEGAS